MSTLSLDELSSSLQAHEARFNQLTEKNDDRTFVVRGEASGGMHFMRRRGRNNRLRGSSSDSPRGIGNGGGQRSGEQKHFNQRQQYSSDGGSWQQGKGGPRPFGRFGRGQRQ